MIALGIDIGGSYAKVALVDARTTLAESQSGRYSRPSLQELAVAVRAAASATGALARPFEVVGLCAPGLLENDGLTVKTSVNIPALSGTRLDEFLAGALGARSGPPRVFSDAHAAAFDLWSRSRRLERFAGISLGTGVGACVLDNGAPLRVSGNSSGHIGQIDVTLDDTHPVPVGPDGGRGSLEAYIGLPALERAHGEGAEQALESLRASDPPLRALARAIRIVHAIYRPDTIALLGGVGTRLGGSLPALRALVGDGLTSLARPSWRLVVGESPFHAALGAAKLAAEA